jgi:hypothetical protein
VRRIPYREGGGREVIRKDDEELLARYQHAVVARRGLTAQANAARGEGRVDYLAEAEAVFNEGQEAAYGWLLGVSPVTPQRCLAAAVNDDTTIAEYRAAEAEVAAGKQRFDHRIATEGNAYDVDKASSYAGGVSSALYWMMSRPTALTE